MEHDPEIRALIREWKPPATTPELDEHMLERYNVRRQPIWLRRLEFRVSIPVPVFVAVAALLVVALNGVWFSYRSNATASLRERMGGYAIVANPQLIVTRAEVTQ